MKIFVWASFSVVILGSAWIAWWSSLASAPPGSYREETPSIRVLVAGDPFAAVLDRHASDLLADIGVDVRFERAGYDAIRQSILLEGSGGQPAFDLVAFDALWTPELARRGVLLPLNEWQSRTPEVRRELYITAAIEGAQWNGVYYGLPIQPHAELFWYRSDILDQAELQPPKTWSEVVAVAHAVHRPEEGLFGIVWNGQRGSALGQSVAHLYAAAGGSIIDAEGRPDLHNEQGLMVADFLKELMDVSPPDILNTAWDQRRNRFISGQAVMLYDWGARMGEGLQSPDSQVAHHVGVIAPPMADGQPLAVPFGTWNFGVLANVSAERQHRALQALAALCGQKGAEHLVRHGNAGVPMRHLLRKPHQHQSFNDLFTAMESIDRADGFSSRARPSTPLWNDVSLILGEVFHDFLRGTITREHALQQAQTRSMIAWEQSHASD